jgi:hypothetical protein
MMPGGDDFDAHYRLLLESLDKAVALLRHAGDTQFADWLDKDRTLIGDGKTHALQHLLSAYGGAGSINDLLFEDAALNKDFTKVRTEVWKHAAAMLRELDSN